MSTEPQPPSNGVTDELYRLLFEHSPLPMWLYDPETFAFVAVNHAAITHYGYSADEFRSQTLLDIRPPEEVSRVVHAHAGAPSTTWLAGRWRHQTRDGRIITVQVHSHELSYAGRRLRLAVIHDVTEQTRAQEGLERQLALTTAITESVADALYLIDREGRFVFLNPAAESALGWRKEELLGRNAHETIHYQHEDGSPFPVGHCPLLGVLQSGREIRDHEDTFIRKDGTPLPVLCSSAPIFTAAEVTGAVLGFQDASARRAADAARCRDYGLVQLLQRVASAANEAATVHEALQATLDEVCRSTGWPVGHVYWVRPGAPQPLVSADLWHLESPERYRALRRATEQTALDEGVGLPGRVLSTGQAHWIPDLTALEDPDHEFPRLRKAPELGVRAALAFPVKIGTDVLAVLEFFAPEVAQPDPDVLDVLTHVGRHLGIVLERQRVREALQERERLAALRADFNGKLAEAGPLRPILQRCVEQLVTGTDSALAQIWVLDDAEGAPFLEASAGLEAHLHALPRCAAPGDLAIERIVREREARLTDDLESAPEFSGVEWVQERGIKAFAGFPLVIEDRVVGVLATYFQRALASELVASLHSLAANLAQCIERKRGERALRQNEERYRSLVIATSQIVWTTQADGRVVEDLPLWRAYTGQSREEVADWGWADAVHPDDRAPTLQVWRQALETRSRYETEYRLRAAGGDYRCFWVRGVPVQAADGSVREWVGTCTDITERKNAEERLTAYARQLEQSNRELQDFAQIASHDLQEPLRKIQAFGDLLGRQCGASLGDEGREYLASMQNAAGRMRSLINALLSLSRVSTRGKSFVLVELERVIGEVLADLELRLHETGGRVEVAALPDVEADPTQLRQLFQNLLGNALKFHRDGVPPLIRVQAENGEAAPGVSDEDRVVITVSDNGIGFDPKYADRIFAPFERLHARSGYEGTGMGLAICRRILERHGGSISASSTPGEGTSFTISLPSRQPERSGSDATRG